MADRERTLDLGNDEVAALAVGTGGLVTFASGVIVRSRALCLLGLAAAVAGGVFYARDKLARRSEKMDAAETNIRAELDDLDPVARAQVLADIARSGLS
jgi:hypothetical protein